MVMTIVVMALMSHRNTAKVRVEPALVICLLVTMAIACRVFTSAMVTMIVWTIVTKTNAINAVSLQMDFKRVFVMGYVF